MSAAPDAPAAPAPDKGSRSLLLLGVTIVSAGVLGLLGAVAVAALMSFLPLVAGVLLGLVLTFGLPLFLALRAARALKRKGRGVLLRRLVTLFLLMATQLAILGSVLDFTGVGTGHLAATGAGVLHTFGGVPVLSPMLEKHANTEHVPLPYDHKSGGAVADAGPVGADGGSAATDAGTAVTEPPKAAGSLSPRTPGGAVVRVAAFATTTQTGSPAVLLAQVLFGGGVTLRSLDLSGHKKLGAVTAVAAAEDGGVAAVLGGEHVVLARAKGQFEHIKALSRDGKLGKSFTVQTVSDVVAGPGGALLAVVEALDTSVKGAAETGGNLVPLLVSLTAGQPAPLVVRKGGDPVPGAPEQSVALGFSLVARRGDGRVVVVETFRSGADDVATHVGGEEYTLNPQRVWVTRTDQPKVQQEITRTDAEPSGIADRTLQAFADAASLPDGRVLFDANFVEAGPSGWLFQWRSGGAGVQAVAPELFGKASGPLPMRAPRTRLLDVEPDGALVFLRDGAVHWTSLLAPAQVTLGLLGATALTPGDKPDAPAKAAGKVTRVDVPYLGQGGQWLLALVQVDGADALVLASAADARAGVCQQVARAGTPLLGDAAITPGTLKAPVRDQLLWTPAPALAADPAPPTATPKGDAGSP